METSSFPVLVVDNFDPWRHLVSATLQRLADLRLAGQAEDVLERIQKATELGLPEISAAKLS